jgi:hypothetical protein
LLLRLLPSAVDHDGWGRGRGGGLPTGPRDDGCAGGGLHFAVLWWDGRPAAGGLHAEAARDRAAAFDRTADSDVAAIQRQSNGNLTAI